MEIGTQKNTPTFLSSGSRSYPAPCTRVKLTINSEAMASSSQISEMMPDKLGEWLLGEFGSDYNEDIDVFVGAGINGQRFLGLNNDSLEALNVSMRFKQLVLDKAKELTKSPDIPDNGVVPVTPGNGTVPVTTGNGVSPVTPGNEASLPLVSECVPLCTSGDLDEEDVDSGPADDESMDTLYSLSAWVPRNVIWRERKELRVKFLDIIPPDWTYDRREMNTGNIMDWANRWSYLSNGIIPKFVHVREPSAPSDIRVQFTSNGRNESKIGNNAKKVKDRDPTMWLCLGYADDDYNEHLVIHEFGHALGLGHEHQRSDFWKHIKPYIDVNKMKTDLSVSDARFCRDWGKDKKSKKGTCTPDYDPQSIMHYWFKKEWLKNGYSSKSKVNADPNLSDKERKALLGVHERHGLAKSPSEMDIKLLKDLYIGVAGDMDNESDESMEVEGGGPQDPSGGPQDPSGGAQEPGASAQDEDMCDLETLPNDPIWDTKPTLGYLHLLKWYDGEKKELRLFKELAPNWEVIAGILQLSDPVIKIIKMNNSVDLSGCIREVISKWLSNGSRLPQAERFTVNWRGFYYLLLDSEESDKAILLKDALSAKKSNIRKTFK